VAFNPTPTTSTTDDFVILSGGGPFGLWRRRVEVESTIRPAKGRIAGFEGREDHRILFASVVRPHHSKMALYAPMQTRLNRQSRTTAKMAHTMRKNKKIAAVNGADYP
jgi:hypothetical protein